MKPETRQEIDQQHVAEAEAAVARQKQIIKELQAGGRPIQGSLILLGLLEDAARRAKNAPATAKSRQGQF